MPTRWRRAERALAAFRLEGAPSNIAFLRALLAHKDFRADKVHTRFVDEQAKALIDAAARLQPGLYFQAAAAPPAGSRQAGARVDAVDPLAVLAFGKTAQQQAESQARLGCARRHGAGARADAGHDRQHCRSRKAMPSPPASRC